MPDCLLNLAAQALASRRPVCITKVTVRAELICPATNGFGIIAGQYTIAGAASSTPFCRTSSATPITSCHA